ncbi:MAG: bifunctional alpha,alpha-trehalose-phosphate synthase (UDP-forming)/trehalose-phosphatase [Lentisphaerae bacterium]|nr:bifunctional alpha,alpha-trehalose-phosphate synthase (UDP-forming)/trehalose-phosphatase [Lentisphaerota bacterium]
MNRVINVANRLPVTVGRTISKSSGGLVSAMSHLGDSMDLRWIGWPGSHPRSDAQRQKLTERLVAEFQCEPVFMSRQEVDDFYFGYSNSLLWPILHYNTSDMRQHDTWWQAYKEINLRFRDAILRDVRPGDCVWVHDYQLMLLPALLREADINLRVGFFLHTPFPSYETFRCIPQREELLRGMLGANVVGFHTYGYMRHFRSSAIRLLAADAEINSIRQEHHVCHMGVYPIGIHIAAFEEEMDSDAFTSECQRIRETHQGKRIVLNVERLDYSKGLRGRLEAIDRFLELSSDKQKIVFVFIAVPSRGEVRAYQELREEIEALVGRINGKHSTIHNTPIQFVHDSVNFTELCASYATADVMLVTPIIDGMNLVAKEYVACRRDESGVLVLSEFAGAANELSTALIVNPYDVDGMTATLQQALDMPVEEQKSRMIPLRRIVTENNAQRGANRFLGDLSRDVEPAGGSGSTTSVGAELVDGFRGASSVACFLDYDGTLRAFERTPEAAQPTERINRILGRLSHATGVDLYLVSGRSRQNMSEWFGGLSLTLVAEHGAACRPPGSEQWQPLVETVDLSWRPQILSIIHEFSLSTPGSTVEDKHTAIVWHYRKCDPEFGAWKAQELTSMLSDLASNLPVEVQQGHAIVEVTSNQFSKGHALRHFVKDSDHDLVVCVGDDTTDEAMFKVEDPRLYSVKVGRGPTAAMRRLPNCEAVLDVLEEVAALAPEGRDG